MEHQKSVSFVTLILTAVAGFCDTATFVAGDGIFSAHVTGNFIVFAAQIVDGKDAGAFLKLVTFPVFIVAVMTGGWLISRGRSALLLQSLILLLCGVVMIAAPKLGDFAAEAVSYTVVMMAVFAMGLQNAFGKMFVKATHGPTTMMTGNVTQASLDLRGVLRGGSLSGAATESLKRQGITIGGFLAGCIAGALLGRHLGLGCLFIPGLAMLLCYFTTPKGQYIPPTP